MPAGSIDTLKQDLRLKARRTREAITRRVPAETKLAFSKNLHHLLDKLPGWTVVSGYLAIGDEIDPAPVLETLAGAGKIPVLPVVVASGQPLVFRSWRSGEALEKGPLKTRHPLPDADQIDPDVLLVPLLAFDRHGYRLGWGGGFYDRTLSSYRSHGRKITTIGIAYGEQEVDHVPHDAYDQRLDYVVTEHGVLSMDLISGEQK